MNNETRLSRLIGRLIKPATKLLLLGSLFGIAASLLTVRQPEAVKVLLSEHTQGHDRMTAAVLLILFVVGSVLATALSGYLQEVSGQRIVLRAREMVVQSNANRGNKEESIPGVKIASVVVSDITLLERGITSALVSLTASLVLLVGALNALASMYFPLVFMLLSAAVGGVAIASFSSKLAVKWQNKVQSKIFILQRDVTGVFDSIWQLRVYGAMNSMSQMLQNQAQTVCAHSRQASRINAMFSSATGLAFQAGGTGALLIGGFAVASGDMEMADVAAFMMLGGMIASPLQNLVNVIRSGQTAIVALRRFRGVLSAQGTGVVSEQNPALATAPKFGLQVRDLTAIYPETGRGIFNVSLDLGGYDLISIVGASGSGKSTLLKVLAGQKHPDSGLMMYDQQIYSADQLQKWHQLIGHVDQQCTFVRGTLKENVDLARSDDSRDAAKIMNAIGLNTHSALVKKDDGVVMDWGAPTLSGGERQRIAITRALISERPLLLLDEPTSALDATSERSVINELRKCRSTTVCVTHRLSLAQVSDLVIVMKKGVVVQVGSHSELCAAPGEYAELWAHWRPSEEEGSSPADNVAKNLPRDKQLLPLFG